MSSTKYLFNFGIGINLISPYDYYGLVNKILPSSLNGFYHAMEK